MLSRGSGEHSRYNIAPGGWNGGVGGLAGFVNGGNNGGGGGVCRGGSEEMLIGRVKVRGEKYTVCLCLVHWLYLVCAPSLRGCT